MEGLSKNDFVLYGVKLAQDAFLNLRSFSLAFSDHKEVGYRCHILLGIKLTQNNLNSSYRILFHSLELFETQSNIKTKLDSRTIADYPYGSDILPSLQRISVDVHNILSTVECHNNVPQIDILARQELLSRDLDASLNNRRLLIDSIEAILQRNITSMSHWICDTTKPLSLKQKTRLGILFALENARIVKLEEANTEQALISSFKKLHKIIWLSSMY